MIMIGKGKGHPRTGHEGPEGYSFTLLLTSTLYGGGWSASRPGRFTPGKTRNPLYRRLGGPQSRSGLVRKISPLPELDPRTVQPKASRYNAWTGIAQLVQRLATGWTVRGSNPGRGEIFLTSPYWLWGPTMGIGSSPGVKRPGSGVEHPPHLLLRLIKK
jgi:hypothetical protein